MLPPYKAEVFSRSFVFKAFCIIPKPTIYFDYLTIEQTTIEMQRVNIAKGDYIHITDSLGAVIYQGIAADVQISASGISVSAAPLQSLFDLTVSYNRADLQTGALEGFIVDVISNTFITNADTLQNIPGLIAVATTETTNTKLNIKSNVHEFYDIITKAFTMYGIVVNVQLFPQSQTISVAVGKNAKPIQTIETKLKNVLEKEFTIGDGYGQLNKMVLIHKFNESQQITYYLHPSGVVDTVNQNRITPVFLATEYVETESFSDDAERRAKETLTPQKFDNLIEITYSVNDRLINMEALEIGDAFTIIDKEIYESVLTGYERQQKTIKLLFGNIRVDLTKKLILERRKRVD